MHGRTIFLFNIHQVTLPWTEEEKRPSSWLRFSLSYLFSLTARSAVHRLCIRWMEPSSAKSITALRHYHLAAKSKSLLLLHLTCLPMYPSTISHSYPSPWHATAACSSPLCLLTRGNPRAKKYQGSTVLLYTTWQRKLGKPVQGSS